MTEKPSIFYANVVGFTLNRTTPSNLQVVISGYDTIACEIWTNLDTISS